MTRRVGLRVRIALAFVLGALGLSALVASRYPGVPWPLLLRLSHEEFAWHEIDAAALQFRAQGGGQLVALVGSKQYFSGRDAAVFYLGRASQFSGRLLVENLDATTGVRARAFLNYAPVAEWHVAAGSRAIFPVELRQLTTDVNDLVIVLRDGRDLEATARAGEARPLLPRKIFHYQLRRAGAARTLSAETPRRRAGEPECREARRVLLARDSALAVINCTGRVATGVFFGGAGPLFYEVVPGDVAVYPAPAAAELFHVSSPFVLAETATGRPTHAQRDLVGL